MRRPSLPRWPLLALALLLAALPAGAETWMLERSGRSAEVPVVVMSRREYVDLADVAAFFDLEIRQEKKRAVLTGPRGALEVMAGRAMATVNGQGVTLGGQVEIADGRVLVPVDLLTAAMPRLVGLEARMDPKARAIRFDAGSPVVSCESFEDRLRVTIRPPRKAVLSDVQKDGQRRIVMIENLELPAQTGGCTFDETLTDLQVQPQKGATRLTFFVGPRFQSLRVMQVDADSSLVFDFFNDSASEQPPARPASESGASAPPAAASGSGSGSADVFDHVVIDAGHGGEDEGAVGPGGLREKELTLAVALEVARILRERANLSVTLTRDADLAIPLTTRTEIANQNAADLFLSIHANATPVGQALGAETYFLSASATDEVARTVAALENDATGLRERGQAASAPLELVLWDLAQQQYLDESSRLAEVVQRELNDLAGTKDRGVKQANFLVLRGATMPAILVEVGFLSNPAEERRMRGPEFQRATAEAIARAILAFRDERRARTGP